MIIDENTNSCKLNDVGENFLKIKVVAVDTLKPVTDGHNLRVKVVDLVLAVDKTFSDGTRARRAEAIVGDQSASIVFTLRDGKNSWFLAFSLFCGALS